MLYNRLVATEDEMRKLPSVDSLLGQPELRELENELPRVMLLEAVRATLDNARTALKTGEPIDLGLEHLTSAAADLARRMGEPSLRDAINATGVIIHTGLGRSVLASATIRPLFDIALQHSNLEIDIETGRRGSRADHIEGLICKLTGAEAAFVVNNNAAAVLLAINTLADGGEVVISRGQLVEIGGQFRIPDIIRRAGAQLVEVGTTNRTRITDYEAAVSPSTLLILRVHPSNFRVIGFTEEARLEELARLGRDTQTPLVDDLGSGALIDLKRFGLKDEPMVQESVRAGADLVTFSGDKLLGGPQAGILVGKKDLIEQCKRNPLARALRVDKLTLGLLQATLMLYMDPTMATEMVPTLRYIAKSPDAIARQASTLASRLRKELGPDYTVGTKRVASQVGGGALPGQELPSSAVVLNSRHRSAEELARKFRKHRVPIFGRIENDELVLDLRTVEPEQGKTIVDCARKLAGKE